MMANSAESKAIVFSQYTKMVDILEWRLSKAGVKVHSASLPHTAQSVHRFTRAQCAIRFVTLLPHAQVVKLLGSQPLQMRRAMLERFKIDPSIRVILMSLKAGGNCYPLYDNFK